VTINLKKIVLSLIIIIPIAALLTLLALQMTQLGKREPVSLQTGYKGTEVSGHAANFELVDQHNQEIELSDFRGEIVVLVFMDSLCEEVCPLTALHLRIAFERMKREEVDVSQVAFLGVNVNVEANMPEDVMAFTRKFGLDSVPSWHFLTGTVDQLEPVWKAYDITVHPQEEGEIIHTPGVYIIDEQGERRWYVSTPLYGEEIETWTTPKLSDLLVRHVKAIVQHGSSPSRGVKE